MIWPNFKPEPEIDLADIERAIELGTDDAALLQRERIALRGLVEMAETRVSELMRPRNKLWILRSAHLIAPRIADGMPAGGYLLATGQGWYGRASGRSSRMLRPSQLDDLAGAAEPVIYVALVGTGFPSAGSTERGRSLLLPSSLTSLVKWSARVTIDDILRRVLAPSRR